MVVKAHHIAAGSNHTSMLFILPLKIVAYGLEEIFIHHILGPSRWIPDNPVQFPGFKINVDHRIHMAAGEGKGVGVLVIPNRIVVEPVVGGPASGFAYFIRIQAILIIPGL